MTPNKKDSRLNIMIYCEDCNDVVDKDKDLPADEKACCIPCWEKRITQM